MPLQSGTWSINANGFQGTLILGNPDLNGNVQGFCLDVVFQNGFWNEAEQKLTFIRQVGSRNDSIQIFTGFQFATNSTPNYYLAGWFEFFAGTGGNAPNSIAGWRAAKR